MKNKNINKINNFIDRVTGNTWKIDQFSLFEEAFPHDEYNNGLLNHDYFNRSYKRKNYFFPIHQKKQIFKNLKNKYQITKKSSVSSDLDYTLYIFNNISFTKYDLRMGTIHQSDATTNKNYINRYDDKIIFKFQITISGELHDIYIATSANGYELHFIAFNLSLEQVNILQKINIPVFIGKGFYFDKQHYESIPLVPIISNISFDGPNAEDIENAKDKAIKSCNKSYNSYNFNCKIHNPPFEYCEPIKEPVSRRIAINNCKMASKNTYEKELSNSLRWLKDPYNIDNSGNVADVIGIDKNNLENDMLNYCAGMNLGKVGLMNIKNNEEILKNENLKKVLEYYKKKTNSEYPKMDENSENYNSNTGSYKYEDKYYKNIHPLKECKEDSYKFMKKLCKSYSLPDHTDPAYMVMPRKCNLQGIVSLLDVCSVRNRRQPVTGNVCEKLSTEGEDNACEKNKDCLVENISENKKIISKKCINSPGTKSEEKGINNDLQRILPYDEDFGDEGSGLCNNVKMDSMGVDGTINIWEKMWKDHNQSLDEIGKITEKFITNESSVLRQTLDLRKFYEDNLNEINEINKKKTVI